MEGSEIDCIHQIVTIQKIFKGELWKFDMKEKISLMILVITIALVSTGFVSAVVVNSVSTESIGPGETGLIRVEIENILDDDALDVSLRLDLTGTPFTPVGSSEEGINEIREGDDESFSFRIKASNDISPGDYQIPYVLRYRESGEDVQREREGTIGIEVRADTDLSFSVDSEMPVIGQEGKLSLKLVNRGFSDAKFVLVKVIPEGYTLLSENEVYIGEVDSDDFETASFDVIFNKEGKIRFLAIVEYKDFNNERIVNNVELPVNIYSREKAIELGIIKKNNTWAYVIVIVALVILWLIWRAVKKRKRLKRSKNTGS